jgi:hypothetical protein
MLRTIFTGEQMASHDLQSVLQVRERDQVGPAVGPTSAFSSCIPTGMRGPTRIFWANLTPFSLTVCGVRANVAYGCRT